MKSALKFRISCAMVLALTLNIACGRDSDETSEAHAEAEVETSALPACQLSTSCSQTLPALPPAKGFRDFYKKLISKGKVLHRGRDVIAVPGAPIWLQAKFSYGILDADLHKEPVDIYFSSGCNSKLVKVGQSITSNDDENEAVDGVSDSGGRIYVNLASLGIRSLPIGRHRFVFVVPADNSTSELYVTIVDPRQKIVVSDIDGTLTATELAAAVDVIGGSANPHPAAAATLRLLKAKGYEILYLTARSEWLGAATRRWLSDRGFPLGTIRTTSSKIPASGQAAVNYKAAQLEQLYEQSGIVPTIAIGNKNTDVAAYALAGIEPDQSFYINLNSDLAGGYGFNHYSELYEAYQTSPKVCI